MIRPQLIIFAKAPIMGRAKTRLAADIGPVHAKRLYRAMTARILRNLRSPEWDVFVAVTPAKWMGRVPDWQAAKQYAQVSGSLSPRLMQAFANKAPTLVIGTDSPQIKRSDIHAAINALKSYDAVFGPADDGGFWLMGLNGPAKLGVFENIRWSTQHALADVEKNLTGRVHYLRTLTDVDDAKALAQVRRAARF